MQRSYTSFAGYLSGADAWRDNVANYGIDMATNLVKDYLDMNLRREHSEDERKHCRELFEAMYEATAGTVDPKKLVYPYDYQTACDRTEGSYFLESRDLNTACAKSIDRLINESRYKPDFYNLELAAMRAVQDYGFPRVCLVLAFNYQNKGSDSRFSSANRKWANTFIVQEQSFNCAWLCVHPILIDGFCHYVFEVYQNLGAERLALPGQEESGEINSNFEIKRAITTFDGGDGFSTGYAIAHNPAACSPWVCWQFTVRDCERHYNWGVYGDDEQTAIDAYIARVFVALNKGASNAA